MSLKGKNKTPPPKTPAPILLIIPFKGILSNWCLPSHVVANDKAVGVRVSPLPEARFSCVADHSSIL